MSTNFCEETFYSYISGLPSTTKRRFYLTDPLLLKVGTSDIKIRFEKGEWQALTPSTICFLPKGKSIEICNNGSYHRPEVDVIPLCGQMLKDFYLQHASLLIDRQKNTVNNQICFTDFHKNPMIEIVFQSTKNEVSAPTDEHNIKIYLNFILSFFLFTEGFIQTLYSSINVSIKDKVYNLIFHNIGKQCCSLDSIAKQLHMSASTLKRRLADEHTCFSKISLQSRMNKAMILSKANNMPMTLIAQEVGYDDIPFFISTFKNYHHNQSPSFV
ncbi:helix-turn-helix domain-containing protein [Providencia rettgeri]|uniref:helix-turn-helix domain-containing protein n=1 Tax=Providencia rettgeri TaxID=587 RepID=UPI0034E0C807